MNDANPFLVEVSRGEMVESRHRGRWAVADADGRLVESGGDVETPVFPRSCVKPLQAIPLVESGAASRWSCTAPELAVACASHGGEKRHVETVTAWLARIGCAETDLECGTHMPSSPGAAEALIRASARPDQRHNNCSGKHTAMLAVCRHLGESTKGYIAIGHPHQKRVVATFEAMLGIGLARAPRGIDGCSLPQFGMPIAALARAYAKFAAPDALPPARAAACRALADAIRAEPFMLSGTGRFCTRAIEACGGKAVVKTGAEGCYIAAIPTKGIGIALKIDDGASRAAEAAMAHLLLRHAGLDDASAARVRALATPLLNAAGRAVGAIAAAPNW